MSAGTLRIGVDAIAVSPRGRATRGHSGTRWRRSRGGRASSSSRSSGIPGGGAVAGRDGRRPGAAVDRLGAGRPAGPRARLDALLTWSDRLSVLPQPPTVIWLFESPVHRIEQNRHAGAGAVPARRGLADAACGGAASAGRPTSASARRRPPPRCSPSCRSSRAGPASSIPGSRPASRRGRRRRATPYVLHLGSTDPRDNTRAAVEACRLADVELVVVGGAGRGGGEVEMSAASPTTELVDLYRGAAAYLDPSLYEGFGYGVLEAMACGAPVVARTDVASRGRGRRRPALRPGVAGGAGCSAAADPRRARAGLRPPPARARTRARVHVGARGGRSSRPPARGRRLTAHGGH